MAHAGQQTRGMLIIGNVFCALGEWLVAALPTLEQYFTPVCLCIGGDRGRDTCLLGLAQDVLDRVAALAQHDAYQGTMINQRWWQREASTVRAAALPEAYRRLAIGAAARIVFRATGGAALRTRAILLAAVVADVALLGYLDGARVVVGEIGDAMVATAVILAQGAQQHRRDLDGDTRIPLLRRWRRLLQMRVPHLLQAFIYKRRTPGEQLVAADRQRVLVGVAARIPLPLLRRHIRSCSRDLTQRSVRLHAQVEGRAEVREQDLPIAPDEQIAGLHILMDQSLIMDIMQGIGALLDIRNKLLRECQATIAIGLAEEVENRPWSELHHKVRLLVLRQLTEVIDRQDVWMLHAGDAARLLKEVRLGLGIELIEAQHLEGQDAAERHRLADLVDIAIAACADEGDNFIDTDMRSLHQKVTALAADGAVRILVSAAGARIEATRHVFYPLPILLVGMGLASIRPPQLPRPSVGMGLASIRPR